MKSKDYKKKKNSYKKDIKTKGNETDASNDVSWYIPSEQLLKDVASFSYAYPLGARLNVGAYGADINNSSIPGIMAIKTSITYGYATEMESPINVASRKMFTYIRHANSGRSNYDAPDLMIYIAAMDQAFAFLSWMRRLYGVMSTYNSQNRYYARAAVIANGANFDNLITNLANFRTYINTYALKIASMCIPSDLGFVNKHMWMYENIYVDKEIDKAQTYIFVPDHTEWRQFGYYEDAGALKHIFKTEPNDGQYANDTCYLEDLLTLADIHEIGKNIIEPILDEQDFQIMSGDILKAYGTDKVYKAYGITETYSVVPVYDSSVLDQIQNTTLIGKPVWGPFVNGYAYPLVQSPSTTSPYLPNGNVQSAPEFRHPYGFGSSLVDAGANIWLCDRIVTFETNSPTPQQMMEATRLCNIATSYDLERDTYVIETIGSEVAQSACIYQFAGEYSDDWELEAKGPLHVGVTQIVPFDSTTNTIDAEKTLETLQSNHALVQSLSQFSRHPMVALTSAVVDPVHDVVHYGVVNGMLFEIDNYTYVNKENLKMMSEQALLGQLKSYQFG